MKLLRAVIYAACLLAALGVFFRLQIASGFAVLLGDRYDGTIAIAILEHWSNVWGGLAHWSRPDYFHPYDDTLGYNDGLFLYGIVYTVARRFGADPFLSAELTNVALRAVGFVGMEVFMRRTMRVAWPYALLAAGVFTLSCTMAVRADHTQLLSVGLVPVFGWLCWSGVMAFDRSEWRRAAGWGAAAAALMGAWLLTAFYMAWFTLLFTALFFLAALATRPRRFRSAAVTLPREGWWSLASTGTFGVLAIIPFLVVYLPTAHATGGHTFFEVGYYSTRPMDLILVGDGNPLLSRMDAFVQHAVRPRFVRTGEHVTGLTWAVLALFIAAGVHLWRTRRDAGLWPVRLLAGVAVGIWVLTLQIGAVPLWWIVWATVPGAKGLRVVVRYQLFMAAPVIAVGVWYLARARLRGIVVAGVAILLLGEQITTAQPVGLDRVGELAELAAVPPPPAGCRSFVVTRARPGAVLGPELDGIYSHNVEAMLLAEWFNVPTINGFSTFRPPDSSFDHPELPGYMDRVRRYVAAHGLSGVCTLDLVTRGWSPLQSTAAPE